MPNCMRPRSETFAVIWWLALPNLNAKVFRNCSQLLRHLTKRVPLLRITGKATDQLAIRGLGQKAFYSVL